MKRNCARFRIVKQGEKCNSWLGSILLDLGNLFQTFLLCVQSFLLYLHKRFFILSTLVLCFLLIGHESVYAYSAKTNNEDVFHYVVVSSKKLEQQEKQQTRLLYLYLLWVLLAGSPVYLSAYEIRKTEQAQKKFK